MAYTVLAFARMAGVTPKALRHYERQRLLAPQRNAAGYRVYSGRERQRLRHIVALKSLGLSLTQIRDLLEQRTEPVAVLRRQRESLESRRRALDRALDVIREVEARVGTTKAAASAALPALLAEAVWSRAEEERRRHAGVARPPDRVSETKRALAHDTLRAISGGASEEKKDALRAQWRALVAHEAGDDSALAMRMTRTSAMRRQWPRGVREWIAASYEMDVQSFDTVADFIEDAWRAR